MGPLLDPVATLQPVVVGNSDFRDVTSVRDELNLSVAGSGRPLSGGQLKSE